MHYGWGYGNGGTHKRARGAGSTHPTPPQGTIHQPHLRCPSTPLSHLHTLPPVFPLSEALPARFGRPFSDPPIPRSLAIYGQKKNQKKHLKTIDIPKSPLRDWGWRGASALRSLKTEDSAVFLMAGLCPFILPRSVLL